MTTYQSTAELRRWWRSKETIWGYVYNDPNDFWEDGDLGEFDVVTLVDCGQFYMMVTKGVTVFKLSKDDEQHK